MAKQLMPKAELERRDSDVPMTDEQFLKIGLFAQLKRKPTLDKFPGALVLRRFRQGEVIFRQGEAGWTAFYILTTEDVLAIEGQQQAGPDIFTTLNPQEVKAAMKMFLQLRQAPGRAEELRTVATVHLAIPQPAQKRRGGLLRRLFGRRPEQGERPLYIPSDGPRDLNYDTLQSSLYEGELFGEMSCLYRSPRSATVVATRDCYMLEMLRNILDQLQKDPAYKEKTDEIYKKRVFQLYLRQLGIFHDLTDEQFETIRPELDLETFEPGQVIFDEHERSDCMYVIRSGLVRIVKKVSALLAPENIRNWKDLGSALREGEQQPASPRGKIWQLLPDPVRGQLRATPDAAALAEPDRMEILHALNQLLKDRALADTKEFQPLLAGPVIKAATSDFPDKKRKDWSDQDLRRFNRLLLETIFGNSIRQYRKRVGPEPVLSYCARGEFIGEMGLLDNQPRGATCMAYGHPEADGGGKESGRVELIRIPPSAFYRLLESCPQVRNKLQTEKESRQKQNQKALATAVWEDRGQVMHSPRFEELGLIQGQRLMLIDLDRCTRCDECVKACVRTHDDRRSRLFLDGPRFDKYLVPTTCRSCLDPVCMVGCPVGSIHRGNNGQIIIEDWCIGCGLCSNNCPYGSIQMHDIGIVPVGARGWKFLSAAALTDAKWNQPNFSDHDWALGDAPFAFTRLFRDQLSRHGGAKDGTAAARDRAICFRLEFRLAAYLLKPDSQFKLELTSGDATATVWINGHEIQPEKPKAGKRDYWLPPKTPPAPAAKAPAPAAKSEERAKWQQAAQPKGAAAAPEPTSDRPRWQQMAKAEGGQKQETPPAEPEPPGPPPQLLRVGRNVVAVRVTPNPNAKDVLLDLRLDSLHKPAGATDLTEEVTQKLVTEVAVVCDLCSNSSGQVPACVHACPHDAAMRVDARFEFPVR
jgi:Fe-S-cluster-containing hydrogenase component 2/CRP-like cAMP-binding protein